MSVFGEVSWGDSGGDSGAKNSKDLFLRLLPGDNEVRILSLPYQYLVHKFKKDAQNPKDFGQKVLCSSVHGFCPLCSQDDKAKKRWFLPVIDRKTSSYKILDISYAIFQQIRAAASNPKIGDPTKYDINIFVNKNGGATGYYTVQAYSREPLSAADQAIRDNDMDVEDLKRRVAPPTPENVQKRIDKIMGNEGVSASAPTRQAEGQASPAPKQGSAKPAPVSLDDDDDDTDFPAHA
jgi:hypothetical protein